MRRSNVKRQHSSSRVSAVAFEGLEERRLMSGGGGGGGGGGGTPKPVLPTPAIPASTFDGIGSGPTYVRESFGFAQGTRYKQNGSITAVNIHSNVNGIRAEYPNNKTETWIAPPETPGGQEWDFSVTSGKDPWEAYTPLEDNGYFDTQNGTLSLNGATFLDGTSDQRPNALLPFAAPTGSASTVSAETVGFFGKTAIGFSSSGAVNRNFEASGQAWLEVDFTGNFPAGGSTFVQKWEFHTGGLSGPSASGTFAGDASGYNRIAVSYDPTTRTAAASINDQVVAVTPFSAAAIKYAGVEGSWYANANNFVIQTGSLMPADTPASTPLTSATAPSTTSSPTGGATGTLLGSSSTSGTVSGSVLSTNQSPVVA